MSRAARAGFVAVFGALATIVAYVVEPDSRADELVLLGAGIVIGELLVLRLEDRSAVPLSFAVMIVLASSFQFAEYALTILSAEVIAYFVRISQPSLRWRLSILVDRLAVAGATFVAYSVAWNALDQRESVAAVLTALGVAAVAQVVADYLIRTLLRISPSFSVRARLAWLAVASSGMLMAVGYRGVDGHGDVGIWGPLLFATPLLAAWYAFERLDAATLSYAQTIESLAMAPEFGGLVVAGHAQRVAHLSVAMGHDLGLSQSEVDDLEKAALLHHLGEVTLEDPEVAGRPDPADVAAVTGGMLREIRPLAGAGDIVAGDADDPKHRLAGHVLRLASEYDDLTATSGTSADIAIETLRSAPAFMHDPRLLTALERAVKSHSVSR